MSRRQDSAYYSATHDEDADGNKDQVQYVQSSYSDQAPTRSQTPATQRNSLPRHDSAYYTPQGAYQIHDAAKPQIQHAQSGYDSQAQMRPRTPATQSDSGDSMMDRGRGYKRRPKRRIDRRPAHEIEDSDADDDYAENLTQDSYFKKMEAKAPHTPGRLNMAYFGETDDSGAESAYRSADSSVRTAKILRKPLPPTAILQGWETQCRNEFEGLIHAHKAVVRRSADDEEATQALLRAYEGKLAEARRRWLGDEALYAPAKRTATRCMQDARKLLKTGVHVHGHAAHTTADVNKWEKTCRTAFNIGITDYTKRKISEAQLNGQMVQTMQALTKQAEATGLDRYALKQRLQAVYAEMKKEAREVIDAQRHLNAKLTTAIKRVTDTFLMSHPGHSALAALNAHYDVCQRRSQDELSRYLADKSHHGPFLTAIDDEYTKAFPVASERYRADTDRQLANVVSSFVNNRQQGDLEKPLEALGRVRSASLAGLQIHKDALRSRHQAELKRLKLVLQDGLAYDLKTRRDLVEKCWQDRRFAQKKGLDFVRTPEQRQKRAEDALSARIARMHGHTIDRPRRLGRSNGRLRKPPIRAGGQAFSIGNFFSVKRTLDKFTKQPVSTRPRQQRPAQEPVTRGRTMARMADTQGESRVQASRRPDGWI